MRYVSIYEAVANAMINLGLEQDEYRAIFTDWAYEATRSIGVSDVNLKTTEIVITAGLAPVPSDMAYPDEIAVRKNGTQDFAYPMFDSSYWQSIPNDDQIYRNTENYYVNVQGNNFVLSSDVTADGFNRLVLRYWGYPVDGDDNPLIPEYYIRAVSTYIEFMYIKRLRNRKRQEIPMSEVDYSERRWIRMKQDAVAQRNAATKPEMEAMIQQWMTMLPNQKRLNRKHYVRRENV